MNPGERKAPLPFTLDTIQQNVIFASLTGKHHMARAKQEYRGGEVSGALERHSQSYQMIASVLLYNENNKSTQSFMSTCSSVQER